MFYLDSLPRDAGKALASLPSNPLEGGFEPLFDYASFRKRRAFMHVPVRPFLAVAVLAIVGASFGTAFAADKQEALILVGDHPDFVEPRELSSVDGVLETELRVTYAENRIGADKVCLRSYNGGLTGPTLRVRPGDTLRIRLDNQLHVTPYCMRGHDPGEFNDTNLHTHGLHVSPSGNSDNVLLRIGPGEHKDFEFKISEDHPSGTFWYHPHAHHSTAIQVASGMAGVLLVEGTGLDTVPEIAAVPQRNFLFQQIPYDDNGLVENFEETFGVGKWHSSGRFTTINGQVQPRIRVAMGAVERWRMVHGGVRESLRVALIAKNEVTVRPQAFHEIALDGLATGDLFPKQEIELEPGYRSDALFVAPMQRGTYYVIDEETPAEKALLGEAEPRRVLAVLEVGDFRGQQPLPDREALIQHRPFKSIENHELTGPPQAVVFDMPDNGGVRRYLINNREFDPKMVPRTLHLGQAAEWKLRSKFANHPFHIHVNPFEVLGAIDSQGNPTTVWRDTLLVPEGKEITVRSRYTKYTGCFVLHCHILDHEDLGMMELVEIVDSRGNGKCDPAEVEAAHAGHAAHTGMLP